MFCVLISLMVFILNDRNLDFKDAYSWDVYGVYRVDSADRDLAKRFLEAMNESKS